MNYKLHYDLLIEKARNRSILKTEYKEIHHILPRCMGGTNAPENLIALFPEEHLVAHLLLIKIYTEHEGLLHAAFRMTKYGKLTNKNYGWLRKKFVVKMRDMKLGTVLPEETKKKISKALAGENNAMFGKNHTDEVKKNQSNLVKGKIPVVDKNGERFLISKSDPMWVSGEVTSLTKGRIPSDETKKKILFDVICPYCNKIGKNQIMRRWHFDNCKKK